MVDWDEIGIGDKACQNPPLLSEWDAFILKWYLTNVTEFSVGCGLLPAMIDRLNLEEAAREIFILKLGLVHRIMMRIRQKEMEKEGKDADKN